MPDERLSLSIGATDRPSATRPGMPPLAPRFLTSFQAEAATRSLTIGSFLVVPSPFRDRNLIVNLV